MPWKDKTAGGEGSGVRGFSSSDFRRFHAVIPPSPLPPSPRPSWFFSGFAHGGRGGRGTHPPVACDWEDVFGRRSRMVVLSIAPSLGAQQKIAQVECRKWPETTGFSSARVGG